MHANHLVLHEQFMSSTVTKLTPTSLAALLCARICHDLISPVGALGTAIEVLDDETSTDMHPDAMDLVRNSSRQAGAKLRFLRLALGAGGSAPGVIAVDEVKSLINDMYSEGKSTLHWDISSDGIEKGCARILLNLTMLAVQAIPRGGDLKITVTENAETTHMNLAATGPKSRLDPAIEKTLGGKAPEDGFDGRTIQPFYTGMLTRELKGTVTTSIEDETVLFVAKIPAKAV